MEMRFVEIAIFFNFNCSKNKSKKRAISTNLISTKSHPRHRLHEKINNIQLLKSFHSFVDFNLFVNSASHLFRIDFLLFMIMISNNLILNLSKAEFLNMIGRKVYLLLLKLIKLQFLSL